VYRCDFYWVSLPDLTSVDDNGEPVDPTQSISFVALLVDRDLQAVSF